MKLLENKKRKIFIYLSFFIIFFLGVVIINLPKTVEVILKVVTGATISSEKIKFNGFGEIEIEKLILGDGKEKIVEAPKVKIIYSKDSLKKMRLEEINIYSPKMIIERKDSNINIIDVFSSGDSSDEKKEEENINIEKENTQIAGAGVPINKMNIFDGVLTFRDLTYSRPIERTVNDVNGYVAFNKETGIDLDFNAIRDDERYGFSFNNSKEPLNMNIKLKNASVEPSFIQYGYDDKEISGATGVYNMDLTISTGGLFGWAKLENATLKYDSLDGIIENVNGDLNFSKEGIYVNIDGNYKNNPLIFKVSYEEETGVNVDIKLRDIPYKVASGYKVLGDLKLPLDNLVLEKVDVNLFYKNDFGFQATVDYLGKKFKEQNILVENLNGKVIFKDGILKLSGKDIGIEIENILENRKFFYDVALDLNNSEELLFNVDSSLITLEGEWNSKKKTLSIFQNGRKSLYLNLEKDFLSVKKLQTKKIFDNYFLEFSGEKNKNIFEIENFSFVKDKKDELKIFGDVDLESLKYKLKMQTENFYLEEILEKFGIKTKLNLNGEIFGKKDKFLFQGDIKDLNIQKDELGINFYGTTILIKDKELQGEFFGEIRKIFYQNKIIEGIKVNALYDKDKLDLDLKNRVFTLMGNVDFFRKNLDLDLNLTNVESGTFEDLPFDIKIKNGSGKFYGNFSDLKGEININDSFLELPNGEKVSLKGKILYKNDEILVDKFKINENILNLNYNLKTKQGNFVSNILEENLPKYYGFPKLKYRLLSKVEGEINNTNIESKILFGIDNIYMSGSQLPNLKGELRYSLNSNQNILLIKDISLLNLNDNILLKSNGMIDIKNQSINYGISKQNLDLTDLEDILGISNLKGEIPIEIKIFGMLKNPKYFAKIYESDFSVDKFDFENLKLDLQGDIKKLNLKEISVLYEGNKVKGNGFYDIEKSKYLFELKSDNIDLSFLNNFVNLEQIKDISGKGEIYLKLSENSDRDLGYLKIKNFNMDVPFGYLYLKDFNIDIALKKDKIILESLVGVLNEGKVLGNGDLTIPNFGELKYSENILESLDYRLKISLDEIKYGIKDYFGLNISSGIYFSDNRIDGTITVNNGDINKILKDDKGMIVILYNFLKEKIKGIVVKSEIEEEISSKKATISRTTPEFNLGIFIKNGINIDINEVSSYLQDIKGKLQGQVSITGKDKDILVKGEVELQNTKFFMGDEEFRIDRGMIISDIRNGYISNFNPNIIFEITSLNPTEKLDIMLQGELKNLNLNITTNQGRETSNLKDIFLGGNDSGETSDALALLLKKVIDSQISSTLLRPVSKTVKDIFGIAKFRIVSDIFNQDALFSNDEEKKKGNENLLGFGAYLEAEDNIYKDKYFWIARIGLIDDDRNLSTTTDEGNGSVTVKNNNVSEFDFKVERRYPSGWSYGVGVEKLNEDSNFKDKDKGNLNYYIDFKFERKYNSIKEIFFKNK